MPRKPLIPLPDFGLIAHFWDTWKTIQGWKGIAVIAFCVIAFTSAVNRYIGRGRAQRTVAAQRKRK